MSGVIVQWLIDPERAPSASDLTDALRFIAARVDSANSDDRPASDSSSRPGITRSDQKVTSTTHQ